jgi:ABC-type glycerol-3-phosphate transport system substrate-binding protein
MHRSTRPESAVVIASALGLAACGGSSTSPSQPAGTSPSNGIAAVYTMWLDGSHLQRVTHSTYWDSAAAWAPTS